MTRCLAGALALTLSLMATAGPGAAAAGKLTVAFLDIGQGDATLVSLPTGEHVLIDGGDNGEEKRLVGYLRARGVKALDMVIMTHPHADHIGGLDLVWTTFPIRLALDAGTSTPSRTYNRALQAIAAKGIPLRLGRPGMVKQYGPVKLEVLAPAEPLLTGTRSDLNNNSIITKWTYGGFSVLMTGDAEAEQLDRLMKSKANLQATVLKVPHHGSRYTMNAAFLAAVKPKVAVVSAGKGNDYKHPHKEALARLAKVGAHTHVTAQRGTLTVTSNGHGFELKAER
jgi:competence protein ComEC